jgi:hypothetical protein
MLRTDVVEACEAGEFHVYAVATVQEALEVLTGRPAGVRDADGDYPEGSLLQLAVDKAREFWRRSLLNPNALAAQLEEEEEEAEQEQEEEPDRERPAAEV